MDNAHFRPATDPNPYAAPAHVEPLPAEALETEAERMRRAHLGHEASLQSWGSLYIFAGGLGALIAILVVVAALARSTQGMVIGELGLNLAIAALCGAVSVAAMTTGWGLRQLDPKSRTPTIVLSILGVFAFPCGTVIHLYVLYLLLSQKGQTVFTADYAEVRRQTPHITYGMPRWNWICLAVLVAIGGAFFMWRWLAGR